MKMIFHYGDPYRRYDADGGSALLPRCFVIGQLTRPLDVAPTGETGTFFVRFHPYGFLPFATIPIKAMENTAVPLEALFGEAGAQIGRNILQATSTEERIALIETFLRQRLTDAATIDQIVASTVETILTANGHLSVDALARQTLVHRRQLLRKFSSAIGLSPKQLSKTIRLQAALKMLLDKKDARLVTLAYAGEYYDQAHFIKDFREFTGLTPKEFYGEHLKMSLIFDAMG